MTNKLSMLLGLLLVANSGLILPAQTNRASGGLVGPLPGYEFITADIENHVVTKYDKSGKPAWTYDKVKPIDVWAFPDGSVLMAYLPSALTTGKGGVRRVDQDKKTVFDIPYDDEIMSCQPLANGNFLIVECHKGLVTELDARGTRISSFPVKSKPNGHQTVRQVRLTPRGTLVAGECYSHKLREYDRKGTLLKELDIRFPYCPEPLPNGNTLIGVWNYPEAKILEIDPDGKPVWTFLPSELPADMGVTHFAGAWRLKSGNTLVSVSCKPSGKPGPRAMLFEVTPDKKVVWQILDPKGSSWLTVVKPIPSIGKDSAGEK